MIKKIATLSSIILFALLLIYCTTDDNTITGPFGDTDKYISVSNFTAEKSQLYSNGDSTTIKIKVLDVDKSPIVGLVVGFSAQFGIITESSETDSSGIAVATFVSNDKTGDIIITADTGVKKHTLTLRVVQYQPTYIELFSESPVLLADGISTTLITAVFIDSVGNPMPELLVTFSTTLGTLYPAITKTDDNGMATTNIRSTENEGVATISATSSITKSIEIAFKKYIPAFIEVSTDLSKIFANGTSTATISAVVKDSVGKPMEGETVRFSTTIGRLSDIIKLTNQDGSASTVLTSIATPGNAIITASSFVSDSIEVEFVRYIPNTIEISASMESVLADGQSNSIITAVPKDVNGLPMSGIPMVFSTTLGKFSETIKTTDTEGSAKTTYTSPGSVFNATANITAAVIYSDISISEDINVQLRGITSATYIDSAKMIDNGTYRAYVRSNLIETTSGDNIISGTIRFSIPTGIGKMITSLVPIDDNGTANTVYEADVLPINQYDINIISELSSAPEISSGTDKFDIPGVNLLIKTIDDEVMGDGEGWALVKATLRESDGNIAIPLTNISWSTTLGTIIGQSKTNTSGHTIDTLRIENSVSQNTNVTITANYGDNISVSNIVTFIPPANNSRLILGFAPDTTGHGIIPCNIDTALAVREVGVSAQLVNSAGNGVNWVPITFSVVPNNFASICPTDLTENNGLANVMMVYPPQRGGEIVRVWGQAPDGTRGSIDVILPKDAVTDDSGG